MCDRHRSSPDGCDVSPLTIVCAWCGQAVGQKPLSGARLAHTVCEPCIHKFFAKNDAGRERPLD